MATLTKIDHALSVVGFKAHEDNRYTSYEVPGIELRLTNIVFQGEGDISELSVELYNDNVHILTLSLFNYSKSIVSAVASHAHKWVHELSYD